MSRIYFEYTKNTLLEYPDYFMSAFFVATAVMLVSIRDVFANLASVPEHNLSDIFNFLFVAMRDTSWILQALLAGFVLRVAFSGVRKVQKNMKFDWFATKRFRY